MGCLTVPSSSILSLNCQEFGLSSKAQHGQQLRTSTKSFKLSRGAGRIGLRPPSCSANSNSKAEKEKSEKKKPLSRKESSQAYARWQVDRPELPDGDLTFTEGSNSTLKSFKIMAQAPWKQIRWGSVLAIEVGGGLSDKPAGIFSSDVTLPQLSSCLKKAAHDPRITGVFLKISPLACGWAKLEELKRHLRYVTQAGKFTTAYMEIATEKEYYLAAACEEVFIPPSAYISLKGVALSGTFLGGVLRKAGVEPQIQRIGKYKSAGDQIQREDMSQAQREVLTSLLESVYGNLTSELALDRSSARLAGGREDLTSADTQKMLDEAYFNPQKLVDGGWVTGLKYEDEMRSMMAQRTNNRGPSKPSVVGYGKYRGLSESSCGVPSGRGGGVVAVLRASGGISRGKAQGPGGGGDGVRNEDFIKQVRAVRDNPRVRAVVLRVDSPGGDALASDLMWRELCLLKREKPVIASMVDVAASGGYYMAMACSKIVAEKLTLTGSIGVITGKFNLQELFQRVGYTKEVLSKGRFAEVQVDNRGFTKEELEYTTESAQHAYESFRNKAAFSRNMKVNEMEALAQGRVWTGAQAIEKGLVDQLGGISTAVAIAKQAAGMGEDEPVRLLEIKGGAGPMSGFAGAVSYTTEMAALVASFLQLAYSLKEKSTGINSIAMPQATMNDIRIESTNGNTKSELQSLFNAIESEFRG